MDKYKICPACHTKNPPMLLECSNCEADLTGVRITNEETEQLAQSNASSSTSDERTHFVRICDCGAKNPANARKCSACNEDISDIAPTPDISADDVPQQTPSSFILSSLDGKYAFEIKQEEVIIGRENAMQDYLSAKSYVSRSHAKLYVKDGELFIENLSRTNYTYINNKRIMEPLKLNDGDELGLGGMSINGERQAEAAYFMVRISQCM